MIAALQAVLACTACRAPLPRVSNTVLFAHMSSFRTQLACALISSQEGKDYLAAMACAANYAWVNRSCMTFLTRQAFAKVRGRSAVSGSVFR